MTATLARDCSDGFAPEDFRHTAALLRSGDDLVVITLSNNLNIVLAALDQAGSHDALVSALLEIEKALRSDPPDGGPQKDICSDNVIYRLDGQAMYLAINAARDALRLAGAST